MPCMGPERDSVRELEIFIDVLGYLREKHGLLNTPRELIVLPNLQKSRDEVLQKLRDVIGEVDWQDSCEGF